MAQKDVAPVLARDYVILKIDTDRTKGGKEMVAATKGKGGGIPWFHVLDAEGAELANSNGPEGNVGCPATDPEIAHYLEVLKKTSSLKEEELEFLRKSLVERREKDKK